MCFKYHVYMTSSQKWCLNLSEVVIFRRSEHGNNRSVYKYPSGRCIEEKQYPNKKTLPRTNLISPRQIIYYYLQKLNLIISMITTPNEKYTILIHFIFSEQMKTNLKAKYLYTD
jgi:hypothetical protein